MLLVCIFKLLAFATIIELILCIAVTEKFQFMPAKIVLNTDGTEIDDSDALVGCAGEVLLALRDGEEWQYLTSK
jgi:hypothetical protein